MDHFDPTATRLAVARANGIPDELADHINGDTADAMREDAQRFGQAIADHRARLAPPEPTSAELARTDPDEFNRRFDAGEITDLTTPAASAPAESPAGPPVPRPAPPVPGGPQGNGEGAPRTIADIQKLATTDPAAFNRQWEAGEITTEMLKRPVRR